KVIISVLAIALTITCCVGLVACNANPLKKYAGEYRFAGFEIFRSVDGADYELYDGDEDDAFNECVNLFTKEYALSEANKQYFDLNADGTMAWHLASYIGVNTSAEIAYGKWDVMVNGGRIRIDYQVTDNIITWGTGMYVDFSDGTIKRGLWLYSDIYNGYRGRFSGSTADGNPTGNEWTITALYKRTVG
ncbi:MAG: hypothetical protein K2N18_04240, partial [Clostridia bacterium]|nr:hypothetical protein [Clostridia bacterium]